LKFSRFGHRQVVFGGTNGYLHRLACDKPGPRGMPMCNVNLILILTESQYALPCANALPTPPSRACNRSARTKPAALAEAGCSTRAAVALGTE
jgi:hypothetical protein